MINGCMDAPFGDAVYPFRLRIGEIEDLEARRDAGMGALMMRLAGPDARLADIRETIRLGLIGGGMQPEKALALVQKFVAEKGAGYYANLARLIIARAWFGEPDDPPGKSGPDGSEPPNPVETAGSGSGDSTPPAP